eukprot:4798305-Prymnesium_polylepis.1
MRSQWKLPLTLTRCIRTRLRGVGRSASESGAWRLHQCVVLCGCGIYERRILVEEHESLAHLRLGVELIDRPPRVNDRAPLLVGHGRGRVDAVEDRAVRHDTPGLGGGVGRAVGADAADDAGGRCSPRR